MNFKLFDLLIVVSFVMISLLFIFKPFNDARAKRLLLLYRDKEIVLSFKDQEIDLSKEFKDFYHNTHNINEGIYIEIKDGKARVTEADCPDHLCMHMGWAENCGDMVICMPNSTALMVDCTGALSEAK